MQHILFDFLANSCKDSKLHSFLTIQHRGIILDTVTCVTCGFQRSKSESFLDLSLQVSGYSTVQESLQAFFTPETLEGVFCSNCNEKRTSLKGPLLQAQPTYLSLQLKRFDMDWETIQRVKVTSSLRFTSKLNVSMWDADKKSESDSNEYELWAIQIHTGAAAAGHYVALVKDWKSSSWFLFDDLTVSREVNIGLDNSEKVILPLSPGPTDVLPAKSCPAEMFPTSVTITDPVLNPSKSISDIGSKVLLSSLNLDPRRNAYTLMYRRTIPLVLPC